MTPYHGSLNPYQKYEKGGMNMGVKSKVYRDAKIQALWERNQRQDESALEILVMLAALAVLFIATF